MRRDGREAGLLGLAIVEAGLIVFGFALLAGLLAGRIAL
jgi:hypothetical protein